MFQKLVKVAFIKINKMTIIDVRQLSYTTWMINVKKWLDVYFVKLQI